MTHPKTPLELTRERRGAPHDQPRMYWVSFCRGDGRRLLDDRPYVVTLDLTPGQATDEATARLDALLRGCIKAANVRKPDDIRGCYLELRAFVGAEQTPPGTGRPELVWPVTWDPERE